jgi:phosphoglycerate dehydrogenase-like enzyme
LIGAGEFAAMKCNAVLVNIARGGVVDHVALADALKRGVIAGAGLDVTEPEPLPRGHPLWEAPNLILSPHLAGACGPIGLKRLADVIGDNMERFAAGKPLAHIITLPQR